MTKWETWGVKDRGWVVRRKIEGATANPYQYIGPMSDMVAPHRLLSFEAAEALAEALNEVADFRDVWYNG